MRTSSVRAREWVNSRFFARIALFGTTNQSIKRHCKPAHPILLLAFRMHCKQMARGSLSNAAEGQGGFHEI